MLNKSNRDYENFQSRYPAAFKFIADDVEDFGTFSHASKSMSTKIKLIANLTEDYTHTKSPHDLYDAVDFSGIMNETHLFLGDSKVVQSSLSFREKLATLIFKAHADTIEEMYEQAECYISDRKVKSRALNKADEAYDIARTLKEIGLTF